MALLNRDHRNRNIAQLCNAACDCGIIRITAVTVKFNKSIENVFYIIKSCRPFTVAGQFHTFIDMLISASIRTFISMFISAFASTFISMFISAFASTFISMFISAFVSTFINSLTHTIALPLCIFNSSARYFF